MPTISVDLPAKIFWNLPEYSMDIDIQLNFFFIDCDYFLDKS